MLKKALNTNSPAKKGIFLFRAGCFLCLIFFLLSNFQNSYAASSARVAIIVSGNAITNYDIEHRIALLHLQHRQGNLEEIAKKELIEEKLKRIEAQRLNATLSESMLAQAYDNFAAQNRMTPAEFSMLLNNINVTAQHFQEYLRAQIEWNRLLSQRYQAEKREKGGMISEQDAVQRMLRNRGAKPSVKEYKLQKITLLLPYKKRFQGLESKYKDAEIIRARFKGCSTTKAAIAGLIDVSVRDIGRVLEPHLAPEWKAALASTRVGGLSKPIRAGANLQLLAVCSIRYVSDDRVAQLMFSIENNTKDTEKDLKKLNDKYLKDIYKVARIKYVTKR